MNHLEMATPQENISNGGQGLSDESYLSPASESWFSMTLGNETEAPNEPMSPPGSEGWSTEFNGTEIGAPSEPRSPSVSEYWSVMSSGTETDAPNEPWSPVMTSPYPGAPITPFVPPEPAPMASGAPRMPFFSPLPAPIPGPPYISYTGQSFNPPPAPVQGPVSWYSPIPVPASQETTSAGATYSGNLPRQANGPVVPWNLNVNITFGEAEPAGQQFSSPWPNTGVISPELRYHYPPPRIDPMSTFERSQPSQYNPTSAFNRPQLPQVDPLPTLNQPCGNLSPPSTQLGAPLKWEPVNDDQTKQLELELLKKLQSARKSEADEHDPSSGVLDSIYELRANLEKFKQAREDATAPASSATPGAADLGSTLDVGTDGRGEATVVRRSSRIRDRDKRDYKLAQLRLPTLQELYRLEESLALVMKQARPCGDAEYKFPFTSVNHGRIREVLREWLELQLSSFRGRGGSPGKQLLGKGNGRGAK